MTQLFTNNAVSFLNGGINATDTTINISAGTGVDFPAPTGGDYFYATLVDIDVDGFEIAWEIVQVTARTADALTVVRGQDNTTGLVWAGGTRIELRIVAGNANSFAGVAEAYTAADVKTKYESNADTNEYNDADKAKVDFVSVTQAVNLDIVETDSLASKVITDHISVTQAVNLDTIETRVNALDSAVINMGGWAANAGTFPGGGTAQNGETWICTISGTVGGIPFVVNDRVMAYLDNASTTVYASNWLKLDYTDQVVSVAGRSGAVSLTESDITDFGLYQPLAAVLINTSASFTTVLLSKLDAIEAVADVTDVTNVTAAGASMDGTAHTDNLGELRQIPSPDAAKTGAYSLDAGDVGTAVPFGTGGLPTIPDSVLSEDDVITLVNETSGDITITCTIATAYVAGVDVASATLSAYGTCSILFRSGTLCHITGDVT
jgi:hypothetical protein